MNRIGRDYRGSSKHLKKDLDLNKTIDKRLIILMVFIVLISSGLIGRLYYIQIVDADHYQDLVYQKETNPVATKTARGEIYDRNGKLIVKNKPINTINYMSERYVSVDERFELAMKFAKRYEVEFDLVERELKDLYLFLNDNGKDLISQEEIVKLDHDQDKIDKLKLDRVTKDHLATLSDLEKEAFKIYLKMNTETQGNAAIILENASDEDIAYLSENQHEFPGFTWGTTWEREYVGKPGLEGIVGSVGQIPAEKLEYMVAKGYSRNDIVGLSGLEYQYEEYLSGIKTLHKENPVTGELEEIVAGRRGHDLYLTIDMDLQEKVEGILIKHWNSIKDQPGREKQHGLDYVITNPQTGEIMSIVGLRQDSKGKLYNAPEDIFIEAFPVGSVVKGATVYMGLEEGVIKPDEVIVDKPMYIVGTQPRTSWTNLGEITDLTALQRSSNIYMFMIAIRLGGGNYIPNAPLNFTKPINESFNLMRNYFTQFGLGSETLVDYPRKELGYKGSSQNGGLLLEFSIGQYDNYNALQLNQYMATIANNGYRLKPFLVKEIRDSHLDVPVLENKPTILNELEGKDSLARVQEGFRLCSVRGDCGPWSLKSYTSAAKTGTAQYYDGGVEYRNNSFVFYAPVEEPEMTASCIHSGAYRADHNYSNLCRTVTLEIADVYMNFE